MAVKTLQQMGDLSPATRIEADKQNKAIIVDAAPFDHQKIQAMVEKLSGSARSLHVLQLHKLAADDVAGSIEFLMGAGPKKKERSRPYWWGDSGRDNAPESTDQFRVEADVENHRVMLYANEIEMAAVRDLLVQLGEVAPKEGNNAKLRVIPGGSRQEAEELLERIRRAWPAVAPNPLAVPPSAPDLQKSESEPQKATPPQPTPVSPSKTTARDPDAGVFQLARLSHDAAAEEGVKSQPESAGQATAPSRSDAGKSAAKEGARTPPPVHVTVRPDGQIVIWSDDPQALDRLEELVSQLTPPRKDYAKFQLKYAGAYSVAQNLEDYFKEGKKEQSRYPYWWDWDSGQDDKDKDSERRLSKRRKLKFIADADSNTILVVGADPSQLATIKDLVKLYDQAPSTDTDAARKTQTIQLQHAKARVVADAVKDVYRDLLSANDKALVNQNQAQQPRRSFYFFNDADNTEKKSPKFKGDLSIGIDETSNTLIVSAPAYLFDHVRKMVQELDDAAAPSNSVRVLRVGPGINPTRLQELLDATMNPGSAGKRAAAAAQGPPHEAAGKPRAKTNGKSATNGEARATGQ